MAMFIVHKTNLDGEKVSHSGKSLARGKTFEAYNNDRISDLHSSSDCSCSGRFVRDVGRVPSGLLQ